jgi:DNA-binding PucR family transcriptional regulator
MTTMKKFILGKFHDQHYMLETIKTYLESNQNMMTASKELFIHRNTLMMRLEKFKDVTGFDVKTFYDGFLIYHLLI